MTNIGENTIKDADEKISGFAKSGDFQAVYSYYKELLDAVKREGDGLRKNNPAFFNKISEKIFKLKFMALNYFDDFEEIAELIAGHFDLIFQIEGYDIWSALKTNLLYAAGLDLARGDKAKELIKSKLLDSECRILGAEASGGDKDMPVTIAQWLKDYHANLGLNKIDNLKRIEYLTNSKFIRRLPEQEKRKLKILFDFYEKIRIPSSDRYGFEGAVPMDFDGKQMIFSDGEAEPIPANIFKMILEVKTTDAGETGGEFGELQQLASRYPAGSFERKAVEEEIGKLNGK